jgi:hypothetical protein
MQKSNERLRVLFLESEDNLRSAIGRLLASCRPDMDPIFVSDGNQAVDAFRGLCEGQQHLDVFVTDYAHPPGPNGTDLIRWIRTLPDDLVLRGGQKVRDVPIVIQSGNSRATQVSDLAPEVLLRKPYRLADLLDAIDLAARQLLPRSH